MAVRCDVPEVWVTETVIGEVVPEVGGGGKIARIWLQKEGGSLLSNAHTEVGELLLSRNISFDGSQCGTV